jgi:hypothetical protein
MKNITDALNLPEAADEDAIVAAIETLKANWTWNTNKRKSN